MKRNLLRTVFPMMSGLAWAGGSGWRYNSQRVEPITVKLVAQPKTDKTKTKQDDTL